MSFNDTLVELSREIPYKWRIQSVRFNKALVVAYIDARSVQDLLDEVVGPANWKDSYRTEIRQEVLSKWEQAEKIWVDREEVVVNKQYEDTTSVGVVWCSLSLYNPETGEWITKESSGEDTNVSSVKGGESDALKRAAVKFGIGRFLYSKSILQFPTRKEDYKQHVWCSEFNKTAKTPEELTKYINWLEEKGELEKYHA